MQAQATTTKTSVKLLTGPPFIPLKQLQPSPQAI
jgi:hypothetical protein